MTREEAVNFFSEFYRGEHHFPSDLKECGSGWMMRHAGASFASYDFNELTRLVLMAHYYCIRVEICSHGPSALKILIWKRQREGKMYERHPTIESAIASFMEGKPAIETENEHN